MRSFRCTVLAGVAFLGAATLVSPGYAQSFEVGPGGFRVDRFDRGYDGDFERRRGAVSRWDAIRAARDAGLADVDDVSRRGPHWVIEGSDRRGNDIRVTVHGWNGRVLNVRRY